MKRIAVVLMSIVALFGLTAGCSIQEQTAFFVTLGNPDAQEMTLDEAIKNYDPAQATAEQQAILSHLREKQAQFFAALAAHQAQERARAANSGNCYTEMRKVFPASAHGWAERVINRESRGNPAAANSRSSARGCFQLLSSLHADKYRAAGCDVSQWANASCNVRAAYILYQRAGTSPWNL